MIIPSFSDIADITDSRYALVMLVSKRARQIVDGADPCFDTEEENAVTIAIKEVMNHRVTFGEPMSDYEYKLKLEKEKLAEELDEAMDVQGDDLDHLEEESHE